jgi:hypothetical protein
MASIAEDNAHLLYRLKADLNAVGFGKICNFFEVEPRWRCPCCFRAKEEFARLDKSENLLCRLVFHHDHFENCVRDMMDARRRESEWHAVCAIENSFIRFAPTLVCEDCNLAEAEAKRIVGAPKDFSFAPHEIASFITVTNNRPHEVCASRAREVFAAAEQAMRVIGKRLRVVTGRVREVDANWEPVGMSATRMLNNARKAMKENEK